jgi:hypothetical protein
VIKEVRKCLSSLGLAFHTGSVIASPNPRSGFKSWRRDGIILPLVLLVYFRVVWFICDCIFSFYSPSWGDGNGVRVRNCLLFFSVASVPL